jgi:hypothetical protein
MLRRRILLGPRAISIRRTNRGIDSIRVCIDQQSPGRQKEPRRHEQLQRLCAKATVTPKQKICWSVVALAIVLTAILGRYATLYWLEVLALPIMGLAGLGLMWV